MGAKGDRTKDLIRSEAYRLFAEKGFKDVTMKDICLRTGLSRGGLYGHYESTEQIFMEIITGLSKNQKEGFSRKMAEGVPAAKILDEVLGQYRQEMTDSANSLSIAICEFFSTHREDGGNVLLSQYHASRAMWRELIEYGMERGEFREVDVDGVFDVIAFSYQGVRMYSRLMPVDAGIARGIIGQIKSMILKQEE